MNKIKMGDILSKINTEQLKGVFDDNIIKNLNDASKSVEKASNSIENITGIMKMVGIIVAIALILILIINSMNLYYNYKIYQSYQ